MNTRTCTQTQKLRKGMEPESPALAGGFSTTELPKEPPSLCTPYILYIQLLFLK